ncbi:immune inhibitor A domain-containing protein [Shewanella zhangzhouensis]|uniref:immune inhibitor A domain-containing protein n=1 Tax=Shewanella zhangzhouensis TaxID=2864213 RepID=UPI001C658431|nr:immune inhibitor A domain-containing protein [Shewanella zhangzhouensis]QYK05251.1 immune inhibitor A [Shewanella zhangzhouensis]
MVKRFNTPKLCALGILLALAGGQALAAPAMGSPADSGVINKERVLYWLIKRGEIAEDASDEAKAAAVAAFVARAKSSTPAMEQIKAQEQSLASKARYAQKLRSQYLQVDDADVTKTVKVLGVLVDFPDLPYNDNRLTAGDTDMYYTSYPAIHYSQLLFSASGFTGPSNQTLISGFQYFQQASGNTFFFTGTVRDWVRADNNAAYYGGNDPSNEDNDKAVPELVLEAVTKAVVGMSASELASYDVEDPYDINGNGNLNEPDGIIDHIMLFHSSIGEEAGGGVLGADAIWSHRFFLKSDPSAYGKAIPGTNLRAYGYTVQPIDAAAGVCTHEFGHDLGLPDEYDYDPDGEGSPVGSWSLMSGGSWTGVVAGSEPVGFSPYARSFLQREYKGKWVKEQEISLDSLNSAGTDFNLVEGVNANGVNQLSLKVPSEPLPFKAPYAGDYQYYSNQGHKLNNAMSFNVTLPVVDSLTLKMRAHWDIEFDFDYMQVQVDGTPIPGNHTKATSYYEAGRNVITGSSANIAGNEGPNHWVELTYDLSAYKGMSKQISIVYKTDEFEGGYGIAIDNLSIVSSSETLYSDDAETSDKMMLAGFVRTTDTRPGNDRRYLIQLRSQNGIDKGLASHGYSPGVVLWFENFDYSDNNTTEHPGYGLIGVVDADQNLIGTRGTDVQIRDAAFSTRQQTAYAGDTNLSPVSLFDDSLDYSAPLKPQAGMILPELGLTMEVIQLAANNSTATVRLKKHDGSVPEPTDLKVSIGVTFSGATANFTSTVTGGDGNYSYFWDFGNGASSTQANPSYTYGNTGTYELSLTVTDGKGVGVIVTQQLSVTVPLTASFTQSVSQLTVSFTNNSSGGDGNLSYAWSFGDGQSSTAASPSHTYAAAGSYTVTLTVTDGKGVSATRSASVTVSAPAVTPSDGGSGGGGSLGWLATLALVVAGMVRRRQA